MEVSLAHPEGYNLIPEVVELSKKQAKASGGSFQHVNSMEEAFKGADIVYPKSWAPYDVMQNLSGTVTQIFCQGIRNIMGVYRHYPGVLLMAQAAELVSCLASK